jgi:hypothetical protein
MSSRSQVLMILQPSERSGPTSSQPDAQNPQENSSEAADGYSAEGQFPKAGLRTSFLLSDAVVLN